ncbi:uncharacterized protein ELE39_002619 [Cryptosporidium sp. chipmunk genotype I]|uniref:uncharacterized protein n=1 Tax=Cryptosporidium sp. chipmunk genotype I TaxID=1280935 RepID=UPI00351A900D|nr:hypothetical protein ELE39_002619 [Cryptosporidium sp. chipmunk genotype I]
MGEDQEWSDSSYVLRRRYRLYWSAILRNVPEGLEGLYETFSRWSVSLGFSLPNLVEESEELCIQKGEKKVYKISFPSRSSTRSFIRLSRRNIWSEISKDSYTELYVYCDPAYKLRPFCDFQTMNLSTCYWVIRGISKDIENEEVIWDLVGRRNPFGEFLKRVVYIRDEEGSNGFCFLQFSSPLTSYRALKWELKHSKGFEPNHGKKKYLAPEFVGTSHVKALLLLCRGLDRFETRTLKTVEMKINHFRDSDSDKLSGKNVISQERALQGYLSFWKRSNGVQVPVDRNSEFQYNGNERYESMYRETLYSSGIDLFPRGCIRLYYCKSLDFLWDWNSRVFMDCQSKSLFEFDSESGSLKFIYNSGELSQLVNVGSASGEILSDKSIQEDFQVKARISQEKLRKEREIRVASFLETARSQLNYNMNTNSISSNSLKDEHHFKRQKITQFFDTSSHATHEKSQTSTSQRFDFRILNSLSQRYGVQSSCTTNACIVPAECESACGDDAPGVCMWSISDGVVTEGTIGEEIGRLKSGSKSGCADEEELICFVCCRVFGSIWERVNHEQKSLLHKYNLEIWTVASE